MKVLHIIKKMDKETNRPLGLTQIQPKVNRYMSCCWDFDIEEMMNKTQMGGLVETEAPQQAATTENE